MPKNIRRKELKKPDQFLGFWSRIGAAVGEYANSHTRALVIGITTFATVIIGSVVIAQVSEGRSVRAGQALDRVQKIATGELVAAGAPPKDDGIPHYATEKERLTGALAAVDGSFAARGPLYSEAMLVRGGLLLDLDRADEAIAGYQALLGGKLDPRLQFVAQEGLGYAYERKGNLSEAGATFSKLGDGAGGLGDFYKDRALYQKGRLAELGGNRAEAVRIYQEVLEKNPTTSLRDEITSRLAVLELQ